MSDRVNKQPVEEELSGADSAKMDLYFWLQALVMALVSLILIFTFVGRIIRVDGPSMMPTLHNNDLLLLQSIGYTPAQGDVVVLTKESFMSQPIVKRVIAVGGQTVDIDYETNTVSVDGVPLNEPYILDVMMELPADYLSHITVPQGSIFVMGDNRNDSSDSRKPSIGTVDVRCVLGKARFILLPLGDIGAVESVSEAR